MYESTACLERKQLKFGSCKEQCYRTEQRNGVKNKGNTKMINVNITALTGLFGYIALCLNKKLKEYKKLIQWGGHYEKKIS